MTALSLEQIDSKFPLEAGGKLVGRATYEDAYADGGSARKETVQLRCAVRDVRPATAVHPSLPGMASVIHCEEKSELTEAPVDAGTPNPAPIDAKFTHYYISDLGWSIASEGERTMRWAGVSATEIWTNELGSFTGQR